MKLVLALLLFPSAAAARKPNIVVVDICSARADHFGLYGYGRDTTPGLDALAPTMSVFDQAMAQSSWCLPNYASLFTGRSPENHGRYTNDPRRRAPGDLPVMAELLRESGYNTAAFTGGIYFLKAWGLDRGFDTFVNRFSTSTSLPARVQDTAPESLAWIEKHKNGRPFFLYLSVDDLHAPYQSDEPERYDPGYEGIVHDTATVSVRFFRDFNRAAPGGARADEFRGDPKHLKHLAAHYDAALRGVDRTVSSFVQRLKASGLWDETVVVITADHGEMLGEKGLLGHTEGLYEGVLRVPLLVHYPGIPGGRRLHQPVVRLDLTPTLLEAAGIPLDGLDLEGASLLPLLRQPSSKPREFVFASSKRSLPDLSPLDLTLDERVIRSGSWKLHFYLYKNRFELYDLEKDPLETNDLSDKRPELVQRLAFELLRHFETVRPHEPSPGRFYGTPAPIEPQHD